MSISTKAASFALLATLAAGCASAPPPRELVDARSAYQKAKGGPAGTLAPADVYTAQKALQKAEDAYADSPTSDETRDLSYVAHRKALWADANGQLADAGRQKQTATAELEALEKQRVQNMGQQLAGAQQQLNMTQQQLAEQRAKLEAEQKARAEAEQKAKDATDKLAGMANMRKESRGVVITLSGNVLFASAKTELLPTAQRRLGDLISALKEDPRKLTIVGHTDSQGNDDANMTLSQKRAEAVRTYLVSQGIESDRVKAMGMGETQPIADNTSAEGRANNRRVEIVLENDPNADTSRGMPSTTSPSR